MKRIVVFCVGILTASNLAVSADDREAKPAAGTIELGAAGSWIQIESRSRATILIRSGMFMGTPLSLMRPGLELSYQHLNGLDLLGLEAQVNWMWPLGEGGLYLVAGIGGGVRQEWLGSFRTARYPAGADVGIFYLVSEGAALRTDFRFRRVLSDPVSDFTEHGVLFGISLLLNRKDS